MPRTVAPVTSIVLDVTRASLAFAVAIAHWTQPYFQEGWPELIRPAVAAVGGFFVLSGYTIRLLTPRDQSFSARDFFVERLSRLWSVALPALALTFVLDGLAYLVNREYYLAGWGAQATHVPIRALITVLFANELWGHDVAAGSNSLFWSLSYEAGFYLLYGVFRATKGGARYFWVLIASSLVGPNILLMLLPWLGGVLLFDLCARFRFDSRQSSSMVVCVVGLLLVPLAGLTWLDLPALSDWLTNRLLDGFGWADRTMGHWLIGAHFGLGRVHGDLILGALGFWLLFLFGFPLVRALDSRWSPSRRVVRIARRVGDATFPVYLLHFPIFVLLGALAFYDRQSKLQTSLLFIAVCVAIGAVAPYADPIKRWLRGVLGRLAAKGGERWQGSPSERT